VRIVVAPDSFKESLGAAEAAAAIRDGLAEVWPGAQYLLKPMADGGEGTVEAVLAATAARRMRASVRGPLGEPVDADWAWEPGSATATLEIAAASGLMRLPGGRRDAARASSHGTGELIRAALDAGARRIVLGLGGSACNDGGAGLLQALGARLLDADGRELEPGGLALARLARLDLAGLDPRCAQVRFDVASDVSSPLCGPEGASAVFGPQKGADPAQVRQLDAALARLADVHAALAGRDLRDVPGAGAAGGAGWAMLAVLGAVIQPGVAMIAALNDLPGAVAGADWVFTGEGRMDAQTLRGKVPFGVAQVATRAGVPVVALAGSLGEGYQALYAHGIAAAFSLVPGPMALTVAMGEAATLLRARARDAARLIAAAQGRRPARC
jgi:glycerate kinase